MASESETMRRTPENYQNGRIVGGYSSHAAEDAEKAKACGPYGHSWRCVDCCGVEADRDILECCRCGRQISVSCSFDEEFS
jgi:hypothetical protein